MKSSAFILFMIVQLMSSCSNSLDSKEYIRYVQSEKNGMHPVKLQNNIKAEVQYQPVEYVALLRYGKDITPEQLDEVRKENDQMQVYTLTLSYLNNKADFINAGISNNQEKQRKLYYFSYSFQDHISLLEDGKELPCVLYHFEKNADLVTSRTFVLGFENSTQVPPAATLILRSPWLDEQPIEITISKTKIPSLKI